MAGPDFHVPVPVPGASSVPGAFGHFGKSVPPHLAMRHRPQVPAATRPAL